MKTLLLEQLGTVTGGYQPPTVVTRGRVVQVGPMRARVPSVEVERINSGIDFFNSLRGPK